MVYFILVTDKSWAYITDIKQYELFRQFLLEEDVMSINNLYRIETREGMMYLTYTDPVDGEQNKLPLYDSQLPYLQKFIKENSDLEFSFEVYNSEIPIKRFVFNPFNQPNFFK